MSGVVPAGSRNDEITTIMDLLPTFCQAAGVKLPDQPIDGASLVPLLADPEARLDREAIYFHYPHYHHSRPAGAIRMGDWKLIEFFGDWYDKDQAYHIGGRSEQHPLIKSDERLAPG